jgi:hypothetical protein
MTKIRGTGVDAPIFRVYQYDQQLRLKSATIKPEDRRILMEIDGYNLWQKGLRW